MILPDFKAFPALGRIIGVDWGRRRCGVAVSSADREFVFARNPIVMPRGDNDLARRVADFATDEDAVGIIVGLPLHGDGTESETTAMVREFSQNLCAYTD
ncbi:MAG: Holliday junction resolvase RuvX, partial [Alphaproteobacteria bacterium]|nr:Holliday junction resolvase RuvX [Alphaproteobacteria bacterium]